MSDKNYKNGVGCFSEGELVSYLYRETGESERAAFERHLSGCSECTDEFANLSDSRFSVYRWQKAEFAQLETPVISGPWQKPAVRAVQASKGSESSSWLDGLVAAFRRPAFVLTLVPALILVAVVMGAYLSRSGYSNSSVADNVQPPSVQDTPPATDQPQPVRPSESAPKIEEGRIVAAEKETKKATVTYAKAVKTPSARRMIGSEMASTTFKPDSSTASRRAPRLSDFEEEDDSSIRLTDLLAETDRDKDR